MSNAALTLVRAQGPQARILSSSSNDDESDVELTDGARQGAWGIRVHRYHAALKGYAATIPLARLDDVRRDPHVAFVSEDLPVAAVVQTLPTGVDRIEASSAHTSLRMPGTTSQSRSSTLAAVRIAI